MIQSSSTSANDTAEPYALHVAEALESQQGRLGSHLHSLSTLAQHASSFDCPQGVVYDAAKLAANQLSAVAMLTATLHPSGEWDIRVDFIDDSRVSRTWRASAQEPWLDQALQSTNVKLLHDQEFSESTLQAALTGSDLNSGAILRIGATPPQAVIGVLFDDQASLERDGATYLELVAQVTGNLLLQQRQEELLSHQEIFQSMCDSMEALLLVLTPAGKITECNAATQELTGFSREELTTRNVWNALMLPADIPEMKKAFQQLQEGASGEHLECYLLTRDGLRRRVSWTFTRTLSADKEVVLVGTGIDITDRCEAVERAVRAEAAAEEARTTLGALKNRIESGELTMEDLQSARRGLPRGVDSERRIRQRREFPYEQAIAGVYDKVRPRPEDFQMYRCRDISSRGFAFLSPDMPDYRQIVVAFGTGKSVVHLTADVRHATRKELDGEWFYVVGCRYTGRVSRAKAAK